MIEDIPVIVLEGHLFIYSLQSLELWQAFFLHSSNSAHWISLLTSADWRSIFHLLITPWDLNSRSTGVWQVLPQISWCGVCPIGILKAIQYAQSASGIMLFHSFPMAFTIFCRMFLIFLLDVSAQPLVQGWYGVAARWFYSQFAETLPVGLVL